MQGAHYQDFILMAAIVNVMDNTWVDKSNFEHPKQINCIGLH